jgi:hypothetical protein
MADENRAKLSSNQSILEGLIYNFQDSKQKVFIARDKENNELTARAKWLNWRAACWQQLGFDDLGMGNLDKALNQEGQERLPVEVAKLFMEHILDFLFADTEAVDVERREEFYKGSTNTCKIFVRFLILVSCYLFRRRI